MQWNKRIFDRVCEIETSPNPAEVLRSEQWNRPLATLLADRASMGRTWVLRMSEILTERQIERLPREFRSLRPLPPPTFNE